MGNWLKQRIMGVLTATQTALSTFEHIPDTTVESLEILRHREGKIVVTAVGKSGFIARKFAATLSSLGQLAIFVHPTEAMHGDSGQVASGDVVFAISHSGNTDELLKFLKHIQKHFDITVCAITGNAESQLVKLAGHTFLTQISEEGSPMNLAPMASTTAALVMSDMIAAALANENFDQDHFAKLHPSGNLGLKLKSVAEVMVTAPVVSPTMTFQEAIVSINTHKKGVVGVVLDGALQGVITDGDVRRFFAANESSNGKTTVDVMTKNPKTIDEENSLLDALQLMEQYKITSLFVLDKNAKVKGLLHLHDVLNS